MKNNSVIIIVVFLVVFDIFVWQQIFFHGPDKSTDVYFLDVGQGDSELVVLPTGVKILIDGGPNDKVIDDLNSVLGPTNRYIDLVILSHPESDHFAGLIDVLKRYKVGVFVFNGRDGVANSWQELKNTVKENNVPVEILAAGDKIINADSRFDFLLPDNNFINAAILNETTLVPLLNSQDSKILFTGDIGSKLEDYLLKKYGLKNIGILKVAHHGSKFSSSENFLKEISPKISVIEVGKNSYGHPTKDVLNRLASIGSQIFRTDRDGTVKLTVFNGAISIFKSK
jgi:competence protein ComEC